MRTLVFIRHVAECCTLRSARGNLMAGVYVGNQFFNSCEAGTAVWTHFSSCCLQQMYQVADAGCLSSTSTSKHAGGWTRSDTFYTPDLSSVVESCCCTLFVPAVSLFEPAVRISQAHCVQPQVSVVLHGMYCTTESTVACNSPRREGGQGIKRVLCLQQE